jgi:hypothetical protein
MEQLWSATGFSAHAISDIHWFFFDLGPMANMGKYIRITVSAV